MPDNPLAYFYDPYLPTVQDETLWFWQGRPCKIMKILNFNDRQRCQIDLGGGIIKLVDRAELSDRNIIHIPDNFRIVLEALRNLLVKMQADPMAGQYSFDEIVDRLQILADSITALQTQLQSVSWGNVSGDIRNQADLQTMFLSKVDKAEFERLWQQAMEQYLQQKFHQIPPFNQ